MKSRLSFGAFLLFAIALTFALAPSAMAKEFKALAFPAVVKGEQKAANFWEFGGAKFTCNKASLEGNLAAAAPTLKLKPEFGECQGFGFANGLFLREGCEFELLEPLGNGPFLGNVSILCPAGKVLKFKTESILGKCEVQVGAQAKKEKFEYENVAGPPRKIDATAKVEGLAYNVTVAAGICPLALGAGAGGKFQGPSRLAAEVGNELFIE